LHDVWVSRTQDAEVTVIARNDPQYSGLMPAREFSFEVGDEITDESLLITI
jgi:hypothetical protein